MIKTLEALIGAITLLIAVVILFPPISASQNQTPTISFNCLKDLDNKGFLRYYAENFQTSDMQDKLRICMPTILDFSVKICDASVCNPDALPNKEIFLSQYLIAGDQNSENRLISLWVWSK